MDRQILGRGDVNVFGLFPIVPVFSTSQFLTCFQASLLVTWNPLLTNFPNQSTAFLTYSMAESEQPKIRTTVARTLTLALARVREVMLVIL